MIKNKMTEIIKLKILIYHVLYFKVPILSRSFIHLILLLLMKILRNNFFEKIFVN